MIFHHRFAPIAHQGSNTGPVWPLGPPGGLVGPVGKTTNMWDLYVPGMTPCGSGGNLVCIQVGLETLCAYSCRVLLANWWDSCMRMTHSSQVTNGLSPQ